MWIETACPGLALLMVSVTPRAGVWIETDLQATDVSFARSLPVRECGLKPPDSAGIVNAFIVTPRAGVWIETG